MYEKYVQLDGKWYEIGDDEHTTTGLPIPPLTPWVRELPEGAKLARDEEPKKAKAKK